MAAAKPFSISVFLVRHEFLVRRLHSLTGLIAGGFMCVHLTVNASVVNSPATFQNNVYGIHALGKILPIVEWAFIFTPLLFHSVIGVWIANNAAFNQGNYRYGSNYRYFAQRITGYILFAFVLYHVFHMHGWLHFDWWLAIAKPLGGAEFAPFNATSTAGLALRSWVITALYAVGILSGVFHFANGVWTAGITWGVWTAPAAQLNALRACTGVGVVIGVIGLSALFGMRSAAAPDVIADVIAEEDRMYEARVDAGLTTPNEHKRSGHGHSSGGHAGDGKAVASQGPAEAADRSLPQGETETGQTRGATPAAGR
ncbi:MAG: succinate dehydrogenase [Planctomycetota bacterium]